MCKAMQQGFFLGSMVADRGTTANGQWKYLIQWRGGQLDDSRMMTETEFKRHECGEQLFTQLKRRIATRTEQGMDKYGKLQHYASTPNVRKDDVIHPQSIAVHVPARMYEAQNMAIPHHEWRTQHPANRPPLKLYAKT